MEYKKILNDNYTLHLINTDRFKTINIVVFFTKKFDKNDVVYGSLLCNNMVYTSKKYNTKNKMAIIGEELYGAKVSSSFGINGNLESFVFSLDFVNPKYTDESYLNKSIDFLKEVLFNPNVNNNEFNKTFFNIIKNDLISSVNSIKDNPSLYAAIEYAKIMYKGTPSSYSSYPNLEELKKVTSKDLYKFYKKLFNGEYKVDIVTIGELDDNIINTVNNSFKNIKSNKVKLELPIKHKYEDKLVTKIDSLKFNQSRLYVGYRLHDMSFYELNYVLKVYNTILGTMNDSILFNIVREENSLCYSIGSYVSKYNPSLNIYAGINKTNYEKTIELIKQCVELMSDKKTISRLFESAKKTINTYLNTYYDDVVSQINTYYNREFDTIDDIEVMKEKINSVTIEEVIELNKKIKLSTIYMLKGDNNE